MDWPMDGHMDNQSKTILTHHYHVAGYKNQKIWIIVPIVVS